MSFIDPERRWILKRLVTETSLSRDEIRRLRKTYVRQRTFVELYHPAPQPFRVIKHPRFYNTPWSCEAGRHKWETKVLMGIPILYCRKCGKMAIEGSLWGTYTKREMLERVPKPYKPRTPVEIAIEIWEKMQENPKR